MSADNPENTQKDTLGGDSDHGMNHIHPRLRPGKLMCHMQPSLSAAPFGPPFQSSVLVSPQCAMPCRRQRPGPGIMGRTAQALPRADPCYPKTRARLTCLRGWARRVLHARGRASRGQAPLQAIRFPVSKNGGPDGCPSQKKQSTGAPQAARARRLCLAQRKTREAALQYYIAQGQGVHHGDSLAMLTHTQQPPCPLVGPRRGRPHTASAASRLPSGTAIGSTGNTVSSSAALCARAADARGAGSAALPCAPCCWRSCAPRSQAGA